MRRLIRWWRARAEVSRLEVDVRELRARVEALEAKEITVTRVEVTPQDPDRFVHDVARALRRTTARRPADPNA